MSDIAIVVAETEAGLNAVASSSGLTLIEGTAQPFTGLETYSVPNLSSVGIIHTGKNGWIAFAMIE